MPSHVRTEKPVVHISLNPDPEDRLSDDELTDIAAEYMEGMGWGGQPYVVYKHTDIDRPHIHIVTVQVDSTGRKIGDTGATSGVWPKRRRSNVNTACTAPKGGSGANCGGSRRGT